MFQLSNCDSCKGRGYLLIFQSRAGAYLFEKCDACNRFESDRDAGHFAIMEIPALLQIAKDQQSPEPKLAYHINTPLYVLTVEDAQNVATEHIGRELTQNELQSVEKYLGNGMGEHWTDIMEISIDLAVELHTAEDTRNGASEHIGKEMTEEEIVSALHRGGVREDGI